MAGHDQDVLIRIEPGLQARTRYRAKRACDAVTDFGSGTAQIAVRSYVVSILSRATDVELNLADRSPVASVIVPISLALAGTALTTLILSRRDVD